MFRSRLTRALVGLVAAASLASCGSDGPPPRVPMPSNVPTAPQFASASAVVEALGKAGIPCLVKLSNVLEGASDIDCTATVDGRSFDYTVEVYDPARFTRDDIGDAIAAGRTAFHQTFVAAGNWYVNVINPDYAPRIAQALGGVVLPGNESEVPDYALPSIPASPRYEDVGRLAAALGAAVGGDDIQPGATGSLTCRTGGSAGRAPNCANLRLYADDAERDKALRAAIAYRGVPVSLVTAANWSVNLCDHDLAAQVARELHGVVVTYDGR
ncbi:MAG: hypothetical protein LBV78_05470 [Kitasatospora sp.]|nr:hypothetical protein [Kitasatospora sp.]